MRGSGFTDVVFETAHENAPGGSLTHVLKLKDDPICSRLSIGGDATDGYYVAYRGDIAKVRAMLEAAAVALDAHDALSKAPQDGEIRIGGPKEHRAEKDE